ncbi:hypothetical protein D9M68_875900 [compost metagenome]
MTTPLFSSCSWTRKRMTRWLALARVRVSISFIRWCKRVLRVARIFRQMPGCSSSSRRYCGPCRLAMRVGFNAVALTG